MRLAGHLAHVVEKRNAYSVLVEKPKGKRQLERLQHRWEDNVKINHNEIGWEDVNWIHLAEDRDNWEDLVNTIMNSQVSLNVEYFSLSQGTIGFSRRNCNPWS
jgi:hypothetical protein